MRIKITPAFIFLCFLIFLFPFSANSASKLQSLLSERFESLVSKEKNLPETERQIVRLYARTNFKPLWIDEENLSWRPYAKAAFSRLKAADEEGLDPKDYKQAILAFEENQNLPQDARRLFELELSTTKALLNFIDDLAGERLTPPNITKLLYIKNAQVDADAVLFEGLSSSHPSDWLMNLTFLRDDYQRLKILLRKYEEIRKSGGWPTNLSLDPKKKKLEKGMSADAVRILRQQLTLLGDLKGGDLSPFFDEALEAALKRFQKRHALEQDGVVGSATLKALNTPVEGRIRQIIVSMERWRWLPHKPSNRYILVNISGFSLKAYESGKKVLEMPVITGRAYRKTPVFTSAVYSIRFNPAWHVPTSIAVKDKLPLVRKDPAYLSRKGYSVYDSNGTRISPDDVDWDTVGRGHFPYRLVQSPGSHNALGKIRFSIKSPFDVYLHDTPDKHLFEKAHRDLSSGCIRVKEPVDLAAFVFNDPAWTLDKISEKMAGTKTENVDLKDPVTVYITYFTAWTGDDGLDYFMPDHYGQDMLIWNALQSRGKN